MPSFWVEEGDVGAHELVLRGEEAHHLTVRRCRVGDELDVIDGCGHFYRVQLVAIEAEGCARCQILSTQVDRGECNIYLRLAPALIKGQRFDYVVEKATEVGVATIDPMSTERGVAGGSENKLRRWHRLVRAAAKQCGRSRVPILSAPAPFLSVVSTYAATCDRLIIATPDAEGRAAGLPQQLEAGSRVGLLVGPEGGFTADEESAAADAGAIRLSWGPTVLRADTAAIVLAALVVDRAAGV